MTTTTLTPHKARHDAVVDALDGDLLPVIGVVAVAGPPALVAAALVVLLALMLWWPFVVVATVALLALISTALLVTIVAVPYLLVRRFADRA